MNNDGSPTVIWPERAARPQEPDTVGVPVVFNDDQIVVVDKPAGMPSVRARTPLDPRSVVERLASSFGPVEAVHRLDRDTSGLLVLARTPQARTLLGVQFERRLVGKSYLAVVEGTLPAECGTVHQPLAADLDQPPRQRVDPILGRPAESRWQRIAVAEHGGFSITLVALEPATGRSHQLRVHLAWLGAPIVGDRLYGSTARAGPHPGWGLALHAARLRFAHPATGARLEPIAIPPPTWPWTVFALAIATHLQSAVGSSADAPTWAQ